MQDCQPAYDGCFPQQFLCILPLPQRHRRFAPVFVLPTVRFRWAG